MTSNPIFYNKTNSKLSELIMKWELYQYQIDSPTLLNQIRYTLARDNYNDAVSWLKVFKDAEWWKEDLV